MDMHKDSEMQPSGYIKSFSVEKVQTGLREKTEKAAEAALHEFVHEAL